MHEYVCGKCGEEFTSNEEADDATCPECEAQVCEHCGRWTGGLD